MTASFGGPGGVMSDILDDLADRGLLPVESPPDAVLPSRPARIRVECRLFYRGSLLGGAIGDALGRLGEGRHPEVVRERSGSLSDFHPWHGWESGPKVTNTDDTQLTMCVAETYVACGEMDPEDLADRFQAWLPEGRGKGRT